MNIRFADTCKLQKWQSVPGKVYAFEDPDVAPFCVAMGWAEETADEPDFPTIPETQVSVDPSTTYADGERKGLKVLDTSKKSKAQKGLVQDLVYGKGR